MTYGAVSPSDYLGRNRERHEYLNAIVFKVTEAEMVLYSRLYPSVSDSKKPLRSSPLSFCMSAGTW